MASPCPLSDSSRSANTIRGHGLGIVPGKAIIVVGGLAIWGIANVNIQTIPRAIRQGGVLLDITAYRELLELQRFVLDSLASFGLNLICD